MKRYPKFFIWIGLLPLALGVAVFLFDYHFSRPFRLQMNAGREYMERLDASGLQELTRRVDGLLRSASGNVGSAGDLPIPEDLKAEGVLRIIAVPPGRVIIQWMGGIDHTALCFDRTTDGRYHVTAVYSDDEEKSLGTVTPAGDLHPDV